MSAISVGRSVLVVGLLGLWTRICVGLESVVGMVEAKWFGLKMGVGGWLLLEGWNVTIEGLVYCFTLVWMWVSFSMQ